MATKTMIDNYALAKKHVGKEYSCLEKMTRVLHVPLPAEYLSDVKSAMMILLKDELEIYSPELQGVPVAFNKKSAKLIENYGNVIAAQSYIHCDVKGEFIVFRPKVKDLLQGVVNKCTDTMIGCLVHDCFYVTIRKQHSKKNQEKNIKVGDKIIVCVIKLEEDGNGVLSIIASFHSAFDKSSSTKRDETDVDVAEDILSSHGADSGIENVDHDADSSISQSMDITTTKREEKITDDGNRSEVLIMRNRLREILFSHSQMMSETEIGSDSVLSPVKKTAAGMFFRDPKDIKSHSTHLEKEKLISSTICPTQESRANSEVPTQHGDQVVATLNPVDSVVTKPKIKKKKKDKKHKKGRKEKRKHKKKEGKSKRKKMKLETVDDLNAENSKQENLNLSNVTPTETIVMKSKEKETIKKNNSIFVAPEPVAVKPDTLPTQSNLILERNKVQQLELLALQTAESGNENTTKMNLWETLNPNLTPKSAAETIQVPAILPNNETPNTEIDVKNLKVNETEKTEKQNKKERKRKRDHDESGEKIKTKKKRRLTNSDEIFSLEAVESKPEQKSVTPATQDASNVTQSQEMLLEHQRQALFHLQQLGINLPLSTLTSVQPNPLNAVHTAPTNSTLPSVQENPLNAAQTALTNVKSMSVSWSPAMTSTPFLPHTNIPAPQPSQFTYGNASGEDKSQEDAKSSKNKKKEKKKEKNHKKIKSITNSTLPSVQGNPLNAAQTALTNVKSMSVSWSPAMTSTPFLPQSNIPAPQPSTFTYGSASGEDASRDKLQEDAKSSKKKKKEKKKEKKKKKIKKEEKLTSDTSASDTKTILQSESALASSASPSEMQSDYEPAIHVPTFAKRFSINKTAASMMGKNEETRKKASDTSLPEVKSDVEPAINNPTFPERFSVNETADIMETKEETGRKEKSKKHKSKKEKKKKREKKEKK